MPPSLPSYNMLFCFLQKLNLDRDALLTACLRPAVLMGHDTLQDIHTGGCGRHSPLVQGVNMKSSMVSTSQTETKAERTLIKVLSQAW